VKFEHRATIAAPIDQVWTFLMDVPKVATCAPGVESVEPVGDDRYRGTLRVQVGPIKLALQGDVYITARDDSARKASMRADAADKRAGGAVKAVLSMSVAETPGTPGSTDLLLETDAQVMGRIGEFGQPIIKRKAEQTMNQFAENLRRAIADG
jgi:carbon monoxide dehydrogenase subunit G